MEAIIEAPKTTATSAAAQAATEGDAAWSRVTGAAAGRAENQSGMTLAAELAKQARARRAGATAGQQKPTGTKPQSTPAPSTSAPAVDDEPGSDATQAASTPDQSEVESGAHEASAEHAEPTETPEGDVEADPEAAEETKGKEPKAVRDLQKRVAKLTAQKKALEARLAQSSPEAAPVAQPVVVQHPELQALDAQIADYEAHVRWFDENPEGGAYKDDQGRVIAEIAPERVALLLRQTERKLAEMKGTRSAKVERLSAEAKAQQQRFDAEAIKAYPWLQNPEAPEFSEAQEVLAELPAAAVAALQSHPKARMMLGWLVTGRRASTKPPAVPAPRAVPPKVVGGATSAAPRTSPQDNLKRDLAEAEAAYEKSGRSIDHTRVLKLRRQLSRA
jgi:hypothetical protein